MSIRQNLAARFEQFVKEGLDYSLQLEVNDTEVLTVDSEGFAEWMEEARLPFRCFRWLTVTGRGWYDNEGKLRSDYLQELKRGLTAIEQGFFDDGKKPM